MSPHRIHCPRGQNKPPNTVLVRRPYRYGNPFDWRVYGRSEAVRRHAAWIIDLDAQPITCGKVTYYPATLAEIQADLGGKNLGCNCPVDGQPCHADTLLRLANATAAT